MTDQSVLILNGPGLADLSDFEDSSYGDISLALIRNQCLVQCEELGLSADFRQTEDLEEMSRWIRGDTEDIGALIINPFGHSRASGDLAMIEFAISQIDHAKIPVVEVHLTNIFLLQTETTRPFHISEGNIGFICGLGLYGYSLAIRLIAGQLSRGEP